MGQHQFHLTTEWRLPGSIDSVWTILSAPEGWPGWWPAIVSVERISDGDSKGVGSQRRMRWRTALPYSLTFAVRTTRVENLRLIEGRSDGELAGIGRWQLREDGSHTVVRYDWIVDLEKSWMRVVLPIFRPLFRWNHDKVMEWGRVGIARLLQSEMQTSRLPASSTAGYSRSH